MNILLVNDDGYSADGLVSLATALYREHNLTVVAPDKCYSGFSHATTFYKKVVYEECTDYSWKCYKVFGTPVDCVKFGINYLTNPKPDIILSGINDVLNLGTDLFYSGTAHVAIEAAIEGIPSLAFSTDLSKERSFLPVVKHIIANWDFLVSLANSYVPINININLSILEFRITEIGVNQFSDSYVIENIEGQFTYKLIGEPIEIKQKNDDCDVKMYQAGYSTITPITLDMTDINYLVYLRTKEK